MRARPVQVRFATGLTSEEYVRQEGWRKATLEKCPLHPEGGCGFARHTPYDRVEPPGVRIARFYCRAGHVTFSLLPDFLASRLSSTLAEVETVVDRVESAPTFDACAQKLRPDLERAGARRWTRRRVQLVRAALTTTIGLLPLLLAGCEPTLASFRARLGVERVLAELRAQAEPQLASLPPPLGFGPWPAKRRYPAPRHQHEAGPDPPRATR